MNPYHQIVRLLRQYVLRQQALDASFGPLIFKLDGLEKRAWDAAQSTNEKSHSAGDINRIRESLVADAASIWSEYCAGLQCKTKNQLLSRQPIKRFCEEYANRGSFKIARLESARVSQLTNGKLEIYGNDFWPTALGTMGAFFALNECGDELKQHLTSLTPGPKIVPRHAIRLDNGIKILRALCALIHDFSDNMLRSIYALGYPYAASRRTRSSEWMHGLQVDINVIYYGAIPDHNGHDNSHYRPDPVHSPLLLRPWLEAITFLRAFKQQTQISKRFLRWSEKRTWRLNEREKVATRLKLYLKHKVISNQEYEAALTMYGICSETIHKMATQSPTDAWVIWKYMECLESAIIQGFQRL